MSQNFKPPTDLLSQHRGFSFLYRIYTSSFGYGAVIYSIEPFCLVEVKLPCTDIQELYQVFEEELLGMDDNHPKAASISIALARYFEGQRVDIPWSVMDLSRFTVAQQAVYKAVSTIPYGVNASYGQVARMANVPRAARFVGTTMANNPYPVFIPCHRVIRSDGSAGGFGGGKDLKERMLALEGWG